MANDRSTKVNKMSLPTCVDTGVSLVATESLVHIYCLWTVIDMTVNERRSEVHVSNARVLLLLQCCCCCCCIACHIACLQEYIYATIHYRWWLSRATPSVIWYDMICYSFCCCCSHEGLRLHPMLSIEHCFDHYAIIIILLTIPTSTTSTHLVVIKMNDRPLNEPLNTLTYTLSARKEILSKLSLALLIINNYWKTIIYYPLLSVLHLDSVHCYVRICKLAQVRSFERFNSVARIAEEHNIQNIIFVHMPRTLFAVFASLNA